MKLHNSFALLVAFLLCNYSVFAKYDEIDRMAREVRGKDLVETHKRLAEIGNDQEMIVRAFFTWMTDNIRYDVAEFENPQPDYEKQEAQQVFRNKKGVCEGYSNLFKAFCDLSSIPCFVVGGHCRAFGRYVPEGHAWNTVNIKGEWRLIDVTWGAGVLNESGKYVKSFNDTYFFTEPSVFIEDHYAFDPAWQLLHFPVKLADYRKPNWKYQPDSKGQKFMYADTIANWLEMDTVNKTIVEASRILGFNPGERKVKESVEADLFNMASNLIYHGSIQLMRHSENDQPTDLSSVKAQLKLANQCISLLGIPSPHLRKNVEEMKAAIIEYSKFADEK